MFVNRVKINTTTLLSGTTASTISIPFSMDYQLVDQAELIQRDFVKIETEAAINPILDYDRARFLPLDLNNKQIDRANEKTTKKVDTSFSIPSFASYITSGARIILLRELYRIENLKPVYCDTDSIKFMFYDEHINYFNEYNKEVVNKLKLTAEYLNIDVDEFSPKDINGEKRRFHDSLRSTL